MQTSKDLDELGTFLNNSVAAGTEGLIVKTLNSTYEPSRRSAHWVKLKKDYLDGVGDTFDVVPIGAWYGKWVPPVTLDHVIGALAATACKACSSSCFVATKRTLVQP